VCGRFQNARSLCEEGRIHDEARSCAAGAALWLYTYGRVQYDAGELTSAADKFGEALQRPNAPHQCKALLKLAQRLEAARSAGNSAFKRGDWEAAVAAYSRALAVDPNHGRFNALLYCNRAAANGRRDGYLDQALGDCNVAIGLDPTYAKAYLRRAELRLRAGKRNLALDDYALAQKHDPTGPVGAEAGKRLHEQSRPAGGYGYSGGAYHGGAGPRPAGRPGGGAPARKEHSHYDVLGLAASASVEDIKKAYRKLALRHHPDKNNGSDDAQQKFVQIQRAYDVLSDAAQRRTYDLQQRSASSSARSYSGFSDEDDLFAAFYQARAASRYRRW